MSPSIYFFVNHMRRSVKYLQRISTNIKYKILITKCINKKTNHIYICNQEKIKTQYPAVGPFAKTSYLFESKFSKVERVAVIFNSALSNFSGRGAEIDQNDIIIRINFGTGIFRPEDLGSKTTIRILGRDWIYYDKNEVIGRIYNSRLYYENDKKIIQKYPEIFKNGLFVFDDEAMENYRSIFGGMMSNGMRSVLLGLSLARKVIIYGADPESASSSNSAATNDRHYPNKQLKNYFHNWSREKKIMNDVDRYFDNLENGAAHNTHLEYFFYKRHPGVFLR